MSNSMNHEFNLACILIAEAMGANHVTIKYGDNYIGGFCTPTFCASVDETNLWEFAPEGADFPNEILHKGPDGWELWGMRYVGDKRGYRIVHVYRD